MVEELKRVVEIAKEASVRELSIKYPSGKISIKFSSDADQQALSQEASVEEISEEVSEKVKESKAVEIKSTYVGILKINDKKDNPISTPNKKVSKGDLLCYVEVLGILHEITSPCDGTISNIFLKDGDIVEYGSTIIEIKPND